MKKKVEIGVMCFENGGRCKWPLEAGEEIKKRMDSPLRVSRRNHLYEHLHVNPVKLISNFTSGTIRE